MNSKLIQEIAKQKELIRLLTEGVIKTFTDGVAGMIRIGTTNMTEPSVFRNLYNELTIKTELSTKGINSLDELKADLERPFTKNRRPNPEKILDEAFAQKIFNEMESKIFGDKKWDKLADLVVTQVFVVRKVEPTNIQLFNQLIIYALKGQSKEFYLLKSKLKPYFDDFFLTYVERKLVKNQIEDLATDEPSWFEKIFKPVIDLGTGAGRFFKDAYGRAVDANKVTLEQKMARMITLMNSISNKANTIGESIDISKEIAELDKITAEIGRIKKTSLEILWNQWKDQMPKYVTDKINANAVIDDPIYLKYVRYFESVTKNDAILQKPTATITRLQAFRRLLSNSNPDNLKPVVRIHRFFERLTFGFLLGNFRTLREMGNIYKSLDKSTMSTIGYLGTESLIAHFFYYPAAWAAYKTLMGYAEKEGGYEMENIVGPDGKVTGKKYKHDSEGKKIPKTDWWWADGEKFIGSPEDAPYFGTVFLENIGEEYLRPWKELNNGEYMKSLSKITIPGIQSLGERFFALKNVKSDVRQEEWNKELERIKQDSIAAVKRFNDSIALVRKTDSITNVAKQKVEQLQRSGDSITQSGVFEKMKNLGDSNEYDFNE